MSDEAIRKVLASSIKAGHREDEPVGILAARAKVVRRKGRNGGVVEVIATTDDIDLDDEVVVPTGADKGYFLRNASVFIDHRTYMEARVGVAMAIRPWPSVSAQRGWLVDVSMDDSDAARDVVAKCENGGMGVSIGFRPTDRGTPTPDEVKRYSRDGRVPKSIVREWEWLELSFTPMPCNVACRVVGAAGPSEPESVTPEPKGAVTQVRRKRMVVMGGVTFTRWV